MGCTERPAEIGRVVARYSEPAEVERGASTRCATTGTPTWARFTVETPDADTNAMLNFWNQVQCRTTLYWSRFVSGYETGLGRGMGTRDSGQDTLGTMHTVPGPRPPDADPHLGDAVRRRPHLAPVLSRSPARAARAWPASTPTGRSGSATTTSG